MILIMMVVASCGRMMERGRWIPKNGSRGGLFLNGTRGEAIYLLLLLVAMLNVEGSTQRKKNNRVRWTIQGIATCIVVDVRTVGRSLM